jgi:tetratricopeptide (TPR) repeat protein
MPKPIVRWFYNNVAAWCVLFRQRDLAIEYYRKMLALDPNDAVALASLGFNYAALGRKREALAIFDRMVALTPDDAEMHFNRGFLLQELANHDAAMAAFRAALERNPDHDRAHYGLALSLITMRRPEEAIEPLKRNTQLQPMSPYGWYQLARVQYSLGRIAETQKILDHLAKFEPNVARQLARETRLVAKTLS